MDLPNCTTPIHWQKNVGKVESEGTGALIHVANQHHILVSAAHVVLHDPLWLPGKPFIELDVAGRIFATAETREQALTDIQDLGFCLLNERAVAALAAGGLGFLSYRQTSFGQGLPPCTRLICSGYPVTKSRDHVRGQITNARMDIDDRALTKGELVALGYDPRIHVALHYDRFKVQHDRQAITGALPRGMSGGPIWHVVDGVPILVAILTDYDAKNKVLRGTRIDPLLFEIRRRILALADPTAGREKVSDESA